MSNTLGKRSPKPEKAEFVPSSSKKRRLIDATKMLLDIAKESADAFPPLKSCLGGIDALIKHYDQFKDVEDKLKDLIPWLTKLKETLTKAESDPKEAERREQLKRSLEDIENTSRTLLEKRKLGRILDKTRDAGTVVTLVEQLRQAILIYRASQQQSMHDQITLLATSFNVFVKIHEPRLPEVKKAASTIERLLQLVPDPSSEDTKVDDKEYRRRLELTASLMRVEVALRSLSDRFVDGNYNTTARDRQIVDDLTGDIRDAIHEYQLSQQKEIYELNLELIDAADLQVLNSIKRARGAGYNHRNRRGCLKGTRTILLDEIEKWAWDESRSPIFWLNGLAGAGKSTIAQTVAERCFANGNLGASFFFSGDTSLRNHDDPNAFFLTLAFQLAHKYPNFRHALVPHLRSNPDIAYESLEIQADRLIASPLRSANIATVIVVDALDECKDKESQPAIISAMETIIDRVPEVKFFITSRPDPQIKGRFRSLSRIAEVSALHDTAPDLIDNDIRVFLMRELSGLATQRGLKNWPTAAQLDLLRDRAARLFVYAVATVRFLRNTPRTPDKRYTTIERSKEDTIHEGTVQGVHRGFSLDSLCTSILQASFAHNTAEDNTLVRSVLAAALLVPPFSPSSISKAVRAQTGELIKMEEVTHILESAHPLLELDEDTNHPVRPFHRLLPDCLTNPMRCSDEQLLIIKNHTIRKGSTGLFRLSCLFELICDRSPPSKCHRF
ncbi:hypothetical protein BJ322DRAFT_1082678 [Thelephora terrestris]|uniref:Nephrocystin 3-like N-terminal domain-containing protein n=1 Tax=Thelephora terrestris TaxID=56493 RepID=A0A9P6H7D7_9AGAM|nr:hypothetical protein BJ322DRAFT_1082678 [Thelephora terrestris]